MSFVLDALLRAQAQRSRGEVPRVSTGLQALAGTAAPDPPAAKRPPWAWMALSVLLTAAVAWGVISWRSAQPAAPATALPQSPSVTPTSAAAVPAAATAPPALSAPPVPSVPSAAVPQAQLRPVPVAEAASSPAAKRPAPAAGPVASAVQAVPPARGAAASAGRSLPAEAVAAVPPRAALPESVRQALPPLTVSGMVYASDPAQRMVLINGELWRQGDTVLPGLVLDEIRAKDVVLRYQGQRFSLSP